MSTFNVELKKVVDDSYEIEIGYDLKSKLVHDLEGGLVGKTKKIAVITDSNVRDLYAKEICEAIVDAGFSLDLFVFAAGEKSKTRETKAMLEDAMLEKGYRRDCAIIAIGGGVVSDLAGFLAGTFARGVPFVNYSTTLLSAADASVGGKTAVDTALATNLIGLFNQPKKVYIDVETWKTLPERQLKSGMAETIKHACLANYEMFEFLEQNMEAIYALQKFPCEYITENNCRIKYDVVMKDELESGLREVLNLGHTVGRAIETVSDYQLLHGEAVSIGMAAQVQLSARLGYMSEEQAERVIALFDKAGLPTKIPEYIDREALVKKLYTDKKVRDGKIRFVLQKGIGEVVEFSPNVYSTPIEESVAREIIFEL
ncbi:MAG: 3-dehydroquinate synthase [Lachnospiraceae bacterium]|nr:3-dehydroquinate synthase [Lachnospiraceae bacterium]